MKILNIRPSKNYRFIDYEYFDAGKFYTRMAFQQIDSYWDCADTYYYDLETGVEVPLGPHVVKYMADKRNNERRIKAQQEFATLES